jgi:hypothetical protein
LSEQKWQCAEARSWFERSRPGFESLRDQGAGYGEVEELQDIDREIARCGT